MRDFFEQQAVAQRRTRFLLLGMALSVTALGSVLFAMLAAVRGLFVMRIPASVQLPTYLQLWPLFVWSVGMTGTLVALAGILRTMSLRGGGSALAEMLDARLVSGQPQDALDRRLLNVVAEMALAAGTPVPQVYVLDREPAINALAAGWDLGDAVICVTRGCLHKLTRSELQGVVAHEFSHLLHGDARLNLRLMGAVYGMVSIGLLGKQLMRGSSWSSRRDGSFLLIGGMIAAVGALGGFLGNLIKAAVSRQREYLADASAVQYTRDPESIARALKKIGGYILGSRLSSVRAEELEHFFFEETRASTSWAWLTTHPPLRERILRLDPSFDGAFITPAEGLAEGVAHDAERQPLHTPQPIAAIPRGATALPTAAVASEHQEPRAPDARHLCDSRAPMHPLTAAVVNQQHNSRAPAQPLTAAVANQQHDSRAPMHAPTAAVANQQHDSRAPAQPLTAAGASQQRDLREPTNPLTAAVAYQQRDPLATALPLTAAGVMPLFGTSRVEPAAPELDPMLAEACDNSFSACALVLALLVSSDKVVAQRQARQIREHAGSALLGEAQRLHPAVLAASRLSRLTLATLAAPALRALSREQKRAWKRCVDALIAEDGAISIFELVISYVLQHWQKPRPHRFKRNAGLSACREAVQLVLSCLAHTGAAFDDSAERAFREACTRLPGLTLQLLPQNTRLLSGFIAALDELQSLRPTARAALIEACAHTVVADGRVTADELTLLRAVCLALDAPLPPLEDAANELVAPSRNASTATG